MILFHSTKEHTCRHCTKSYFGSRPPDYVGELETQGFHSNNDISLIQHIYAQYDKVIIICDLTPEGAGDALAFTSCLTASSVPPRLFWDKQTIEQIATLDTLIRYGVVFEEADLLAAALRRLLMSNMLSETLKRIAESRRTLHIEALVCGALKSQFIERLNKILDSNEIG